MCLTEREKVRQRGIGAESRARALRVAVIHLEGLLQKEASLTFLAYLNIGFVAKQLKKTLFCHDASKYRIFCRKLLKYAL